MLSRPFTSSRPQPHRRAASRLHVELLEDRTVPSLDFGWALGAGSTGGERGWGITTDGAGDVYIAGQFEGTVDFDPGPGTLNLVSGNAADAFVAKYTAAGSLAWAVSVANSSDGIGIAVDGAGNVYATGQADDVGAFLVKLNATDGALLWTREVGNNYGTGVDVDGAGNVYVTGNFDSTSQFGPFILTGSSHSTFVTKLDADGNFLWAVAPTSNSWVDGERIVVDSAGNAHISGSYASTVDFDPGIGTHNLTSMGDFDIFVWKLDAAGSFVWAKSMGSTGSDGGNGNGGIALDGAGNVHVAGGWSGSAVNDFDPGPGTLKLAKGQSSYVVKLNSSGNLVWGRSLPGRAYAVAVDGSANVYTTGRFSGSGDFDPGKGKVTLTSAGSEDVFVSKLTSAGNFADAVRLGGGGFDIGWGIAVDSTNNVYTSGQFRTTADFDPGSGTFNMTSGGDADIFVSKLTQAGGGGGGSAMILAAPTDSSSSKSLAPVGLDGSFTLFGRFIFDPTLDRPTDMDLIGS